jgi:hypothetical protein
MIYTILPYVKIGNKWSISYEKMIEVWKELEELKLHEIVFYGGKVTDSTDFIDFFQTPGIMMHFCMINDDIGGFGWLDRIKSNSAYFSGCGFPIAWGKHTVPLWEKSFEHWFSLKHNGKYIFDTFIGETPIDNSFALDYLEKVGARKVGIIPNIAVNVYKNTKTDMVISYKEREE